ncbi:MAG: universal stress protein F [Cocleimonas sp.]|jgi:universal stress protein F
MYKSILVPIDVNHIDRAKEMIDAAKAHSDENTKILLLNVVEVVPAWAASYLQANVMSDNRKAVKSLLAEIVDKEDARNVETLIRNGNPYRTILDIAEKEGVDLIIIGSHKPGLGAYFLGSIADKVVHHAKCAVFIIR